MLKSVVVMSKGTARVIRGVDEDALDLAGEPLLERFEGQQVVAEDEPIVEQVAIRDAMRRMVGVLTVLQQDARLQLRPVLLPDPGELEFRFLIH